MIGASSRRRCGTISSEVATMRWYHYVAYFFGGAFLANAIPHLVNGISGRSFKARSPLRRGKGSRLRR